MDCTGDADVAYRAGAPTRKTPAEQMQAASVMFHLSGVDKQAFLSGIRADPATYADWSAGEWTVDTSGKEDGLFSPFLRGPAARRVAPQRLDRQERPRFDDSIGIYPEFIGGYGVLILPTTGRYLHIPYRALLPRGVRNLLVAGRAIGGDRIAHAATRNMPAARSPGRRRGSRPRCQCAPAGLATSLSPASSRLSWTGRESVTSDA